MVRAGRRAGEVITRIRALVARSPPQRELLVAVPEAAPRNRLLGQSALLASVVRRDTYAALGCMPAWFEKSKFMNTLPSASGMSAA